MTNETNQNTTRIDLPIYSGSHEVNCHVCQGRGVLLCCDSCPYVFHPACLHPIITQRPSEYWHCPVCTQDYINGDVSSVYLRCSKQQESQVNFQEEFFTESAAPPVIQSYVPTRISTARHRPHRSDGMGHTSNFRGIYNRGNKWNAQIQVHGKKMVLFCSLLNT